MRRRSSTLSAVFAVGFMIALVGCTAEDPPPTESAPSELPATDTAEAGRAGNTEAEESEESDAAPAGTGQCLHGTWLADNEFYLASMREYGEAINSVTGRVTVTFAPDGTIATEYADWLLSSTEDSAVVTIARTGIDTGVYSVTSDAVTFEETSVGSSLTVTAAGMEMPIDPIAASYSNAGLTCDATTATISTIDGTLTLTRE